VEQKAAVAASHHRESKPDETAGLIAQLVRNPVALGDRGGVEEGCGDFGIGRALKPAVERAQGENEPVAPIGRENTEIGPGFSASCAAPQSERGGGADVEEPIKGQEDREWLADISRSMQADARAAKYDNLIVFVDSENGLKAARG